MSLEVATPILINVMMNKIKDCRLLSPDWKSKMRLMNLLKRKIDFKFV